MFISVNYSFFVGLSMVYVLSFLFALLISCVVPGTVPLRRGHPSLADGRPLITNRRYQSTMGKVGGLGQQALR